jgi:hypothetical protein
MQLKRQGAEHRYIPLLVTAPGIGWINAYMTQARSLTQARS